MSDKMRSSGLIQLCRKRCSHSSLNALINIRIPSRTELTDLLNSYEYFMQMADRPTQTRVRVLKIKNYVFLCTTPRSLFKISRTIPKPPALMSDRKDHAISARLIPLSRRCLCLLLLTSFLGRSADVLRALQQIGRCASSAERERAT
jgi:hypothetical protein